MSASAALESASRGPRNGCLAQQIDDGAVRSDHQNGCRHPIHLVAIGIRVLQTIPKHRPLAEAAHSSSWQVQSVSAVLASWRELRLLLAGNS